MYEIPRDRKHDLIRNLINFPGHNFQSKKSEKTPKIIKYINSKSPKWYKA